MASQSRVEIAPASWRDLRGVWALERVCFGPDAWGVLDIGFALLSHGVRLKAISGRRLIGFVMGEPRPHQGFAWIATIGVHPDFQRQGIGSRLLVAAEARLTVPVIKLTVRKSNSGAIALYRKFGYIEVAVWDRYYAGGEAGLLMEKRRVI